MKVLIFYLSVILTCLHLTSARGVSPAESDSGKVASIHGRIISSPSSGHGTPTVSEYQPLPAIERTIATHRRNRRFANNVPSSDDYGKLKVIPTIYPKHHLLQPIQVIDDDIMPVEDLSASTAPFTDNHHSWKKPSILIQNL